jgi:hypothetical protein
MIINMAPKPAPASVLMEVSNRKLLRHCMPCL